MGNDNEGKGPKIVNHLQELHLYYQTVGKTSLREARKKVISVGIGGVFLSPEKQKYPQQNTRHYVITSTKQQVQDQP
uniref:Uncharacterized protein n=1 Tax=Tetranychus urticae TaxID=32264 RepID=T1KA98_TETUR